MNGHSTAVVKAQLSSRHTFPVKQQDGDNIPVPAGEPDARRPNPPFPSTGSSLKGAHSGSLQPRFQFLEALASLSRFFSGTDFPEKAFARTDASFLFIFILFILQFLFLRMRGFGNHPAPPPGNTAYILYQVSLVHKKKQFLVILDTIRRKTFIENISPSTPHPLLRVNQGAGHPLFPISCRRAP